MQCPDCKDPNTRVQSTVKITGDDPQIIRKRKCAKCGKNFQTVEKENKS